MSAFPEINDLSAAYDTVDNRVLTRTFLDIPQDVRLTELVQNMSSNRRNLWTSSANAADDADRRMAIHKAASLPLCCSTYTWSFMYADDMCIATQKQSFEEVEQTRGDALTGMAPYYAANHLRDNPEKTQISTFHLKKPRYSARTEGCMAW